MASWFRHCGRRRLFGRLFALCGLAYLLVALKFVKEMLNERNNSFVLNFNAMDVHMEMFGTQQKAKHSAKNEYGKKALEQYCLVPKTFDDGRIFTLDLPAQTNYSMIQNVAHPRFQEYVLPVSDASVAYGPRLDHMTVYIIPFSHVDPGYGMTLEQYYSSMTKHTLDNLVVKLEQYPNMTFQWAETVFLERWWRDISPETKATFRRLVNNGQLEIVLGGWVMPDEAVTHYGPVIDQLIEGHQWLKENVGVKPKNAWVNDPFGYSSTLPYLWKMAGVENIVILRIHQAVKATLMRKHALEFNWRQMWDPTNENDIFCHLMAYRGYWIGDTCGPNHQHICREYAFMHKDPRDKVVFLTKENIAERSRILYEEYRITAELYRKRTKTDTNLGENLFLPMFLGEDFSYVNSEDYDLIYKSYAMMFEYMNNKTEWKIKIKFGTINEYMTTMKEYHNNRNQYNFPSLSGDFFPYSDFQNDYWTGYYSTRPFLKQLSRDIQRYMKAADLFHTYARFHSSTKKINYAMGDKVTALLTSARRGLGIYLHHDGITGTSVPSVMQNFNDVLFQALNDAQQAFKHIASNLISNGNLAVPLIRHSSFRHKQTDCPSPEVLTVPVSGSLVVVANSLPRRRVDVITFHVSTANVEVTTQKGKVKHQIQPAGIANYQVSFVAELPPLSLHLFNVTLNHQVPFNEVPVLNEPSEDYIENDFIKIVIDQKTGFPTRLILKQDENISINVSCDVLAYTAKRSGAYIFAPEGEATQYLKSTRTIKFTKGPITSEVKTTYDGFSMTLKIYNAQGAKAYGVFIETMIDMSHTGMNTMDKEVILRLKSDIDNKNVFFTDQNGYQLLGRFNNVSRSIEENYYPVTTMILIEDTTKRLTLHTAQPHGATSLKSGWIEVMLDRKLSRDDDKGLGQGVTDNLPTMANFVLQLERITSLKTSNTNAKRVQTYPSADAMFINEQLNEPSVVTLIPIVGDGNLVNFNGIEESLPCDTVIVGMRHMKQANSTSLVLHRRPFNCAMSTDRSECNLLNGAANLNNLFKGLEFRVAKETSLTHLTEKRVVSNSEDLNPHLMQLRSFELV
ncbi:alpha-mannosidase 2x-like [Dreissena polymorpha]|uniref:Alpha-mannosidase n=1 Tax=Dreissena polymorpha TaxID=45954 RepID=A0A9D4NF12_DREPO|nr:alpha-mannosidase 2x-like [Dreissena polymorpha]XP_052253780.1 alpha-mannosidase 2x-like [Dreissena polymorpha]XP_052253790.1 alpha-mannosidase 2x-like [Dreissena polymorpha]XP_052253800.1 alpha-mannosidase 2x-like [Dreissena polymorpha]XP_052253811.1 alpha-mannosidase 2x-like [Dreissena polymorpha]KAH3893393.1 hypothetical protein DPMN_017540 [Dreissena polymorpha]